LKSLVKGVVTTMLKISALSSQWLNADPIGQGERLFFRKNSGEKHRNSWKRSQGKYMHFG